MKRAAYPLSFFGVFLTVLMTMLLNLLFIDVNFSYIHSLAGWNFYQVLAVVGSFMIIEGIMWVLFAQLNSINNHIKEGTLDGLLLKPVDDQFMVSFSRGDSEDFVRCLVGFFLIFLSMKNTSGFNFLHFTLFLFLILNGVIIFYSFNIFCRSFSFWLTDGSGLWLFMERVTGSSQYPIDIYYHKIVRGILTFIVPLAFIATVPAKILTNVIIDWKFTGLSFLMVMIFFFGSRAFWKFSLKHYSSASS